MSRIATASFLARLDAGRINAFHARLFLATGWAWLVAGYVLALAWSVLGPAEAGATTGAGIALGALLAGFAADRRGRATVARTGLALVVLTTLLATALPFDSALHSGAQLLVGAGVGAVLLCDATLLAELWPRKTRSLFPGRVRDRMARSDLARPLARFSQRDPGGGVGLAVRERIIAA